jgi:hypothetical protein
MGGKGFIRARAKFAGADVALNGGMHPVATINV